jgi:hypothetical protein
MITSHILVLPRHKFCVRGPKILVWALSMDQAKGRQEKKKKKKKKHTECNKDPLLI